MPTIRRPTSDYDTAWKEVLDRWLPRFMLLLFPAIHEDIDWSKGYEPLDKELQQVKSRGKTGRKVVDKLFKVYLESGRMVWVLIHIEIQNRKQAEFPERMFIYSYRIYDVHRHPVASLAVLGDNDPEWRPTEFGYEIWETGTQHKFKAVKLLDFEEKWEMLEQSDNPLALVIMIHLRTLSTQRKPLSRLEWKLKLVKAMYEKNFSEEEVVELFWFMDWVMALPPQLEQRFEISLKQYEEEKKMRRLSPFEQRATERGMQQGAIGTARESVLTALDAHFGAVPGTVQNVVSEIMDEARLKMLLRQAITARTLDEFERSLASG